MPERGESSDERLGDYVKRRNEAFFPTQMKQLCNSRDPKPVLILWVRLPDALPYQMLILLQRFSCFETFDNKKQMNSGNAFFTNARANDASWFNPDQCPSLK